MQLFGRLIPLELYSRSLNYTCTSEVAKRCRVKELNSNVSDCRREAFHEKRKKIIQHNKGCMSVDSVDLKSLGITTWVGHVNHSKNNCCQYFVLIVLSWFTESWLNLTSADFCLSKLKISHKCERRVMIWIWDSSYANWKGYPLQPKKLNHNRKYVGGVVAELQHKLIAHQANHT